jgi:hypothetical protein
VRASASIARMSRAISGADLPASVQTRISLHSCGLLAARNEQFQRLEPALQTSAVIPQPFNGGFIPRSRSWAPRVRFQSPVLSLNYATGRSIPADFSICSKIDFGIRMNDVSLPPNAFATKLSMVSSGPKKRPIAARATAPAALS